MKHCTHQQKEFTSLIVHAFQKHGMEVSRGWVFTEWLHCSLHPGTPRTHACLEFIFSPKKQMLWILPRLFEERSEDAKLTLLKPLLHSHQQFVFFLTPHWVMWLFCSLKKSSLKIFSILEYKSLNVFMFVHFLLYFKITFFLNPLQCPELDTVQESTAM